MDRRHAISVRAAEILGSPTEAEDWLRRPAQALDGQRPIDLLGTAEGRQALHDHLTRLECERGVLPDATGFGEAGSMSGIWG